MQQDSIIWRTIEHGHREQSTDWYWAVGIITVSLAIAFFIVGNSLLSIILLLGVGTLFVSSKRSPQTVECEISEQGIRTDRTLYPWQTLSSFWIHETVNQKTGIPTQLLLLTSKKSFMPQIIVPLGSEAPLKEIQAVLAHMLTEEPQTEPISHRIMQKLGF